MTINDGTVAVDGSLRLRGASAPWSIDSELNLNGGRVIADQVYLESGGILALGGGALTANTIFAEPGDSGEFLFTGGTLHLAQYWGNLTNDGGTLAPGNPIGSTYVGTANEYRYYQNSGKLQIEIAGADPNDHDYLYVGHTATLGGDLEVALRDRFVPDPDDPFVILFAENEISGRFENASGFVDVANGGGFDVTYSASGTVSLDNYQSAFAYKVVQNTTAGEDWRFMGPAGIWPATVDDGQMVDLDFAAIAVADVDGPDFNVYEYAGGIPEFDRVDVLVSKDGTNWVSVKSSEGPMVRIDGDEGYSNEDHARSYDLAGTGLSAARYVRVLGINGGGFDLDAVGIINKVMWPYTDVLSLNSTGQGDDIFVGPPDDRDGGLGGQIVEYDFGCRRVLDGDGPDFNVYEMDHGVTEFDSIDVLVSIDGFEWVSVKASEGAEVPIPGDEAHGSGNYSRSYDLAGSGLSEVRYIRLDGDGDEPGGGSIGFDLDAIGAIHVPLAWIVPGDTDRDGDVDLMDLAELLGTYGACSGDAGFNPNADFNGDGCVDLFDLADLLGHYGK